MNLHNFSLRLRVYSDFLKLWLLIILDHIRSVPRQSNLNFFWAYWKIYYHPGPKTVDVWLDQYHSITQSIWTLRWLTPQMYFHSYKIDKLCFHTKDGDETIQPSIRFLRFDSENHVYFISSRRIQSANEGQIDRAMVALDNIYNEFDYPNASLIFVVDQKDLQNEKLNLVDQFPEAIFDSWELTNLKAHHLERSKKKSPYSKKVFVNTNVPGTIITYWTFDWVFQKMMVKFLDSTFMIERSVYNAFNKRMEEDYADPMEMFRWAQAKTYFQPYDLQEGDLEYFGVNAPANAKFKSTEECIRQEGQYLLSTASKSTFKYFSNIAPPVPLILFPSKGCLKGSNEDRYHIQPQWFCHRWWKILIHNWKMIVFIYLD